MKPKEAHHNSPADRARSAVMPANNRSRVGNGSALPSGIDGRTGPARRWKEIFRDGMDRTGGRHEQTCRSLASMVLQRETLDAALARGEPIDTDLLLRLASEIRRTMTRLGLDIGEPAPDATEQVLARIRAHRVDTVTA